MQNKSLALALLAALGMVSPLRAGQVWPGICVSSKHPVNVYLNGSLVCQSSFNCAIVHLRPLSIYQIEVRDAFDEKARPLFSDQVRTPEGGMQTVVVQGGKSVSSQTLKSGSAGSDLPSGQAMVEGAAGPGAGRARPTRVDLAAGSKPLISEDGFANFMATLEQATPQQLQWLVEGKMAQHAFLVAHVRQILEAYTVGDELRAALIKKMYGSLADRENAFQLLGMLSSGPIQNDVAEYIAQYNANNPR